MQRRCEAGDVGRSALRMTKDAATNSLGLGGSLLVQSKEIARILCPTQIE